MNQIAISCLLVLLTTQALSHPYLYNPYHRFFRYNDPYFNYVSSYANQFSPYAPAIPTLSQNYIPDPILTSYISQPDDLPTLNILAEVPFEIKTDFTVVPMLVVAQENMKTVSSGVIMGVSKKKPVMTVKTETQLLQCTPAVKIVLKTPIVVYSLKTSILFPSEIDIVHQGYSIPIKVGAVIAPIAHDTFVSTQSPVSVNVVYAVPTRPVQVNYVSDDSYIVTGENQAVIVDSEPVYPQQNITIISFPDKLAEPVLEVDEEDDELVNRNPPQVLAPAGIVQSTQPQTISSPFSNSKESPILTALREEALKHRL